MAKKFNKNKRMGQMLAAVVNEPTETFSLAKELRAGSTFEKCTIVEEIGRGGMGVVYKAIDNELQRVVAIKTIVVDDVEDAELLARFYREMEVSARFSHPHIVNVYRSGVEQDIAFIIMEYVAGKNLDDFLQCNNVSISQKLQLLMELASALHYAHEKGIVHRDLKPGNIIVTIDMHIVILDFGIARYLEKGKTLTRSDKVVGTWAYMAPEQLNNPKKIDVRTDIYAMGVILYEMFTGQLMISAIDKVTCPTPTAMRKLDPKIPRGVEIVWRRSTSTKQSRRYASAADFARDIRKVFENRVILNIPQIRIGIYAVILLLLVFFAKTTSHYYTSTPSLPTTGEENYVKYAENLMETGAFEEAYKQLHLALQEQKIVKEIILEKLILVCCSLKRYTEVNEYYEECHNTFLTKQDICLAVVEAQFYQRFFTKAHQLAQKVFASKETTLLQRQQALFYIGLCEYNDKNYSSALVNLQKLQQMNKGSFASHFSIALFYIGSSHYHLGNFLPARHFLQKTIKLFPQMASAYEYLGKSYLDDELIELTIKETKAIEYFKKCVELQPQNSQYLIALGNLLYQKQHYNEAAQIFRKAIVTSPVPEATGGFLKAYYHELSTGVLNTESFLFSFENSMFHFNNLSAPDLFADTFLRIKQQYQNIHIAIPKDNDISVFIHKLCSSSEKTIAEITTQALLQMCHHPSIEKQINNAIATASTEGKTKLRKIKARILQRKRREKRFSLYHYLAEMYLQKQNSVSAKPQDLQDILMDDSAQIELRYLAARALIHLTEFASIEQGRLSKNGVLSALCMCVLREAKFFKDYDEHLHYVYKHSSNVFLRTLILQNLRKRPTAFFQKALQDENPYIKLAAAKKCFFSQKPKLKADGTKVLRSFMNDSYLPFRMYSHFHFWQQKSVAGDKLFAQYAQTTDKKIQRMVLQYAPHVKLNLFANGLLRMNPNDDLYYNAIYTVAHSYPFHDALKKIIYNEQADDFARSYALMLSIYGAIYNQKFLLLLSNLQQLKKWLITAPSTQKNFLTKVATYKALSKTIGFSLKNVSSETNAIKTVLLSIFIGERNLHRHYKLVEFSRESILNFIFHCKKSRNARIEMLSCIAEILFVDNRDAIYEKAQKKSISQYKRTTIARGFFELAKELAYRGNINLFSPDKQKIFFSEGFLLSKYVENKDNRPKNLRRVSQAIHLDNSKPQYHYYQALLYKAQGDLKKAETALHLAFKKISPQNQYFTECTVDFLHLLWEQQRFSEVKTLWQNIRLDDLDFDKLWLMHEKLLLMNEVPQIPKIFKLFCLKKANNTAISEKLFSFYVQNKATFIALARIFARNKQPQQAILYLSYAQKNNKLSQRKLLMYPEFHSLAQHPWFISLDK